MESARRTVAPKLNVEASEKNAERNPVSSPGAPLIALFSLCALLLGLSYLSQGVSKLQTILHARYDLFTLLLQMALTFFDFVFGGASIVIGIGLFFRKEWARKAWLVFVIYALLMALQLTALQFLAGYSNMIRVYGWIGLLVFVSSISWIYLSKARIKARFL